MAAASSRPSQFDSGAQEGEFACAFSGEFLEFGHFQDRNADFVVAVLRLDSPKCKVSTRSRAVPTKPSFASGPFCPYL
jgi:hypothetical protein